MVIKTVIASAFCRKFLIRLVQRRRSHRAYKRFSGTIIEVILCIKMFIRIIILAQSLDTYRACYRVILACYMVWNKVYNNFHSCLMGTFYQILKLIHAAVYIYRKIRIDIIIVSNSIRRACLTFNNRRMLAGYPKRRIISSACVPYNTRIPYMAYSHILNLTQPLPIKVIQLTRTILSQRSIRLTSNISITKEAWKNLINNEFTVHEIFKQQGDCATFFSSQSPRPYCIFLLFNTMSTYSLVNSAYHALQSLARSTFCEVVSTVCNHILYTLSPAYRAC